MSEIVEFVGVILVDNQGRVALQLRAEEQELNPDHWSVFGGHIEEGEGSAKAAIREIEEELSVKLSEDKLVSLGRFEREDHAYTIFYYRVEDELEDAVLKEGVDWRWCSMEEIKVGLIEGKRVVSYHVKFLGQFFQDSAGK
jgi:ADP-ribose pyrophosphatase YjhB (NUDIX family)